MQQHDPSEARRPLKVRGNQLSKSFARWLSQKSITPNQISILSIVFALLSAMCFLLSTQNLSMRPFWLIAAVQLSLGRLLCN